MNPHDLSHALRRIASAIDASKSPSRALVARDLNSILSRLASPLDPSKTDLITHCARQVRGSPSAELAEKPSFADGDGETAHNQVPQKTAVIITGNPKFIEGNPYAHAFYNEIKDLLEQGGYDVSFNAGEPYTSPPEADLWVGHSRGVDRLQFAPEGTRTVALGSFSGLRHPEDNVAAIEKFNPQKHGHILPNKFHYMLTDEMKRALLAPIE